jgi:ABC-type protease/lipase transport system fused ATPase/permease subunit
MGPFTPQKMAVAAIICAVALVVGFVIAVVDRLTESRAMRTRFNEASDKAIADDNLLDETRRNARELLNR